MENVIECPAKKLSKRGICLCLTENVKCTNNYYADGTLILVRPSLPYQGIARKIKK